jgi:TRAP-type mannitol/chloroaromatic compound transport system permease small subunit
MEHLNGMPSWLIPAIIIAAVWDAIWRLIALWKSAQRKQLTWFIFLGIVNSVGLLPIIYLLMHRDKD